MAEADPYPYTDSEPDSDDEYDNYRKPTREEWANYSKQVKQSDGFEVDRLPDVFMFYKIGPIDLSLPHSWARRCELLARMAIDQFNKSEHKEKVGKLEFVKLISAMGQASTGMKYYLTLTAKNVTKGGMIGTYQAATISGISDDEMEVLSFRPKPSDGAKKEWFWEETRCCPCC